MAQQYQGDQGMAQNTMPVHMGQENDGDIQKVVNEDQSCYVKCLNCGGNCFGWFRAWFPCCCCCCPNPFISVMTGFVGLKENVGSYSDDLGPGLHRINPWTDKILPVNLKTRVIDLRPQIVMTNDNVSIKIDGVVYFRVINAAKAQYRVQNLEQSVTEKAYGALRSACGEHTMQELLEKREHISHKCEFYIEQQVSNWGVCIENVFIKDMILSQELQDDMAAAAKQKRIGQSKVISAKADVESAKLLREAADTLDSKAAMQIRYLETIQNISQKGNTPKVMFLPLNSGKSKQGKK